MDFDSFIKLTDMLRVSVTANPKVFRNMLCQPRNGFSSFSTLLPKRSRFLKNDG